jgi:GDP-4-dehydro-6-deoxy-D-mannose reductase
VAAIALGKAEPIIRTGDLAPTIDFSDVRDVVRAYADILEKGKMGEAYNVCSGKGIALRSILAHFREKCPIPITITEDAARIRANKTSVKITGSHSKLTRDTGWNPSIPFTQTLDEIYDYWFRQLSVPTPQ